MDSTNLPDFKNFERLFLGLSSNKNLAFILFCPLINNLQFTIYCLLPTAKSQKVLKLRNRLSQMWRFVKIPKSSNFNHAKNILDVRIYLYNFDKFYNFIKFKFFWNFNTFNISLHFQQEKSYFIRSQPAFGCQLAFKSST